MFELSEIYPSNPRFFPLELAALEDTFVYEGVRDASFVILKWTTGEPFVSIKEPQDLAIELLVDHPDNPRLVPREDVIGPIEQQISEVGFQRKHAITVRWFGDHFQILSGHHRVAAARRAGLATIPCWISDMDDDEALMELAKSNTQGELSGLEIGLHALKVVGKAKAGRGNHGGYSEYARRIGKSLSFVSLLALGAEVFETVKSSTRVEDLLQQARHLAEIHIADQRAWPLLVERMVKGPWSVADTKKHVDDIRKFAIPDRWAEWLPYEDVVSTYLTANFGAATVNRLIEQVETTIKMIEEFGGDRDEYLEWLNANRPNNWNMRALKAKHEEIRLSVGAPKEPEESWLLGNWRDHVDALENGSVSLLLTDPPYGMNYQSHIHDRITNDSSPDQALSEFKDALGAFSPKLADNAAIYVFCHWRYEDLFRHALEGAGFEVRDLIVWSKNQMGQGDLLGTRGPMWEGIIHATRGAPSLYGERHGNVYRCDRVPSVDHPTEKPVELLRQLIEETTVRGQLVVDPFGGVASTALAAKESGRQFWGCEIEPRYHDIGQRKLDGTAERGAVRGDTSDASGSAGV